MLEFENVRHTCCGAVMQSGTVENAPIHAGQFSTLLYSNHILTAYLPDSFTQMQNPVASCKTRSGIQLCELSRNVMLTYVGSMHFLCSKIFKFQFIRLVKYDV